MNKFPTLTIFFALVLLISGCTPSVTSTPAPVETSPTPPPTATVLSPTATVPSPTPTFAWIEDVIEWEMRASFDFFWEQANTDPSSPGYGLIRDRYPGSPGIASIASVGFGLTAYVIGVEKGYITRQQACERIDGTLSTLLTLDREHGFYYHFLDMQTGKRAWNSEVSSIDTAILLMGVLTAGQYCGGETQAKAEQIYVGIDWPWFVDPQRNMFYMAYRPEKGFEGHWDFYAEQLMLYVLAAGSPTHPIDPSVYYTFIRHKAKYGDGQPFIHSWFGSIFTYQYSHAWIDFRNRTDRQGVNWFNNSVEATKAHYNFAVAMDEKYLGLGPLAWGLTACDSPNGYEGRYGAPPSGYDYKQHLVDDTIAPAGAIGSIIFLPEEAKRAMLYYYTFDRLKGRYGFLDAFNLTQNWFATDVIGIDKGITLLMLANYQGDLVYRVSMANPYILRGLERLEIK
ncbi:MAG: glucoamylase family protein [Anaerolineales bacterium]|nr:glucoamylase family protein [Anaerolineales bacterium]